MKTARQKIEEDWKKASIDYKSFEMENLKKQMSDMEAAHEKKLRDKGNVNVM